MKKILLAVFALFICYTSFSQNPPVTNGLIQYLSNPSNDFVGGNPPGDYPFHPWCSIPVTSNFTYSFWKDQSGMDNDVQTQPLQTWCDCSMFGCPTSTPILSNANPQYVPNALGTGFDAVYFDRNDFMETIPGAINPLTSTPNPIDPVSGLSPASGLASTDNVTEMTIFVVRMAHATPQNVMTYTFTHPMVSVSATDGVTFPGIIRPHIPPHPTPLRDEFALMRDWAAQIDDDLTFKDHQCFDQTPSNRPVVLSGVFGTNFADIDYFVNNIQSTNPVTSWWGPTLLAINHNAVNRLITIGSRQSSQVGSMGQFWPGFFEGYIFEVLVYNRKLTATEIDITNQYLQCKYDVTYSACNSISPNCPKVCWLSPALNISYLGMNSSGDCIFDATAVTNPMPGVTNVAYEWHIPGLAPFVIPPSTSTTSHFGPFTTSSYGNVTVKVLGTNVGQTPGLPCCEYTMSRYIWCGDIDGGTGEKPSSSTPAMQTKNGISIYPNPTDKDLFIKIEKEGNYTINVVDFIGKVIERVKVQDQLTKISLNSYAAGVYMVQIIDNEGKTIEARKIILNN